VEGEQSIHWPVCTSQDHPNPCCVILDSIGEGVLTMDLQRRITSIFNKAAERITGFTAREALGRHCFDVLRSSICQTNCPLQCAISSRQTLYDVPCSIIDRRGREIRVSVTLAPILDPDGRPVGGVETIRDLSTVNTLREALAGRFRMGEMVSKSPRMQEIFDILPDIAESDSTVLIQGPTGSGKEVMAAAIHDLSPRRTGPFLKVNCAAIPDTLLESELFGYVRGAFTDAKRDKPGRFALAHGGTLFLDEVADTSPALQVKLLRVLEEKQFMPLGGTAPVKVDVRIIAATNHPLEGLVEKGAFRDDLYYRLNIIKIQLPPLRERREDIPLLVEHFLARLNALKGKNILGVSPEVMGLLLNHSFPGNIRELENLLEHAYVLCKGPLIQLGNLPMEFLHKSQAREPAPSLGPLESSEALTIQEVLKRHNGSRILAARELGLSRTTLWRKMKRLGLE
jgi:PAS domain S-box-containing protein